MSLRTMVARGLALVAALFLVLAGPAVQGPASAQTPVEGLAVPPADAERWEIGSIGGRHGSFARWTDADGVRWSRQSLLLRGFVTEIDQRMRFGPDGALRELEVRGRTPSGDAAERFVAGDGRYSFQSPADKGGGDLSADARYTAFGGTYDAMIGLVDALRAAPGGSLAILPSGRASLEELTTATVELDGRKRTLTAYAVMGLDLSPTVLWYEGDRFFGLYNFLFVVPEGWSGVAETLADAQAAALAQRAPALVRSLARVVGAPVAFTNVRLYDADARTFHEGMTVVAKDGRIAAVGPTGRTAMPDGTQVVDARGKTLLPGLWDNHQHYGDDSTGPLLLSQGITSVRDPGNRPSEVMARKARIEKGELLGPRIIPSMLIDGPGPLSAQVAVVVANEEDARAAAKRAKAEGFFGIKLYGSLKPDLVPVLIAEAKAQGLRVHGHIPAGMRPLDAVRAGYDEITHINMVMMQAMPDEVISASNGLLRFYGPGRHAADVDLESPEMQGYLDELARRGTAVDPTVAIFENGFTIDPGTLGPAYAPFEGTLPPVMERAQRDGGFAPLSDLSRDRMSRSFAKIMALLPELYRRGVRVVAGTDGPGLMLVRELELYVKAGLTPAEALATATIIPAETYGLGSETGSVVPGKRAELLLVDGDPSRNIGDLRRVWLVMQGDRMLDVAKLRGAVGISGPPR